MELYNLENDEAETINLASQYPEILLKLQKQMDQAHTKSEHPKFRLQSEKNSMKIRYTTTH